MRALLLGIMVIFFAFPAFAANFYVDNLLPGNDANACNSETSPCLTIAGGIAKMMAAGAGAAHTVFVKNGTYNESNLTINVGGVSNATRRTLKNFAGHSPIVNASGGHGFCVGCDFVTRSQSVGYVTIEGFEIRNASWTGIKYNHADNLIIRNNYIHDVKSQGILGGGINVTIDRNRISHTGTFSGNQQHGLYVGGSRYTITNNVIEGVTAYCMQIKAYPDDGTVPTPEYAGVHDWLVANNTCAYQLNRSGIVLEYVNTVSSVNISNVHVKNNLFFHENTNNSFAANQSMVSCEFDGGVASTTSGVVVQNNAAFRFSGSITKVAANCPAGISESNNSANVSVNNPNLVNAPFPRPASGPDLHLTSNSTTLLNLGLNMSAVTIGTLSSGVTTDHDGRSRPLGNGYDIGACEFSSNVSKVAAPRNLQVR
jgi:hypothetical protein